MKYFINRVSVLLCCLVLLAGCSENVQNSGELLSLSSSDDIVWQKGTYDCVVLRTEPDVTFAGYPSVRYDYIYSNVTFEGLEWYSNANIVNLKDTRTCFEFSSREDYEECKRTSANEQWCYDDETKTVFYITSIEEDEKTTVTFNQYKTMVSPCEDWSIESVQQSRDKRKIVVKLKYVDSDITDTITHVKR